MTIALDHTSLESLVELDNLNAYCSEEIDDVVCLNVGWQVAHKQKQSHRVFSAAASVSVS